MSRLYPVPEAIGGRWVIHTGRPRVDLTSQTMYVPTGDTPEERFLRAHEMAHAKITPRVSADAAARKAGVPEDCLQAVEDLRVHNFLANRRVERPGGLSDAEATGIMQRVHPDVAAMAKMMVASCDTGDFFRLREARLRIEKGLPDAEQESIRERWGVAYKICDLVRNQLYDTPKRTLMGRTGFLKGTVPAARLLALLTQTAGELVEHGPVGRDRDEIHKLLEQTNKPGLKSEWADMEPLVTAAMSTPSELRSIALKRRFADHGVCPTAMHRLPVDQRVFSTKRRAAGGTILLDASGSMSIEAYEIVQLLLSAPAATVAMYSGNGDRGWITVIGKGGKCADETTIRRHREAAGGNNAIDGHALRWLARQEQPRIWVSDGEVNGRRGDGYAGSTAVHYADAARVVRMGRITQVRYISQAAELVAKRR